VLDWLRKDPQEQPFVEVGDKQLPIVIRRLAPARRMTLRLSPDGREVRLSIPEWGRTAEAIAFVESRRDWLASQLCALPQAEPIAPGVTIAFRGEPVVISHDNQLPRKPQLQGGSIRLGGPPESIPSRLKRWLEGEARRLLTADLAQYCDRAGRPAPQVALSSARRRWGSCGPSGTIRINWRLVMAPNFVRRSVVAHEVAHLVHFNHSPDFHTLLGELFEGDTGVANDWLKREGRSLYLPFG
jgi:predicted metal-dependent hydrolase